MKCISLWQPWASLIVIGAKQFETRSWPTSYRGPILIHAAKKWNGELYDISERDPFLTALCRVKHPSGIYGIKDDLPLGCIIGVVELVECYEMKIPNTLEPYLKPSTHPFPTGQELNFGEYRDGRFAWKLANPRRFSQPIPYPGRQQIFNVPDSVIEGVIP